MTEKANPCKRCCGNCHHFQAASPDEQHQHLAIGWCWWLVDHPRMKYEVPEWMLPWDYLALDSALTPRVALAADDGAYCPQWRARLGRRDWTG